LSIEGKKGIRVGKIPRWEAELWSHVGGGDSIHCPLHSRCPVRKKYLKMGGVHCPPVPAGIIKLFDQQHAIEVRQVPLKVYHGAIWSRNDEWVIQIKDNDAFATRRFTLFHEAFHILAHCRTSPVFRKRGSILGSFNELLADYFALCALMPREWVRQKWTEVEDLNRMAEIFAVPKSAMCIRLRQLGLI
jgi:hypothetical protein